MPLARPDEMNYLRLHPEWSLLIFLPYLILVVEAMSSTKSIPFQYFTAAPVAILKNDSCLNSVRLHFYGTEAINAFAEGTADTGQCFGIWNCFTWSMYNKTLDSSVILPSIL